MRVRVIGQTWEASVTGGWFSATDYTIPDDTPLDRFEIANAIRARHSDFRCIQDISVPGQIDWLLRDSEDTWADCMYPEEAEA